MQSAKISSQRTLPLVGGSQQKNKPAEISRFIFENLRVNFPH
jgi:hypothetical protein